MNFKNSNGVYLSKSLFLEEAQTDTRAHVCYTLKDEDYQNLPSLRRLYLEISDPSEYRFAMTHLGGWKHFELLASQDWFLEYLNRWRRELRAKLSSEALVRIHQIASGETPTAFAANKYILEALEKPTEPLRRVGRPLGSGPSQKTHYEPSLADYKADAQRLLS